MFAVIKTGGKQYRVAAEDKITVMTLEGQAGDAVTFGDVMMLVDGEAATVGAPFVAAPRLRAKSSSIRAGRRSSPSRSAAARTPSASAVTGRT